MALIELRNLSKTYELGEVKVAALRQVNLDIAEGEFVALIGPSGSGKSTLMNTLGCLDRPTEGTYSLAGELVSGLAPDQLEQVRNERIGFVFQNFNLLSRTTALENVEVPLLYNRNCPRRERKQRATEMLQRVGLADRLDHRPNQLSGGQQQRVAIARALVNQPSILFADEPTGNLASDQAEDILRQLELLNRSGITVIMVTHDPDIAQHARRIIHIKDGHIVSDERKDTDVSRGPAAGDRTAAALASVPTATLTRTQTTPADI